MSIKTNELPQAAAMADSDSFIVTTAQGTKKTPLSWIRGLFAPAPLAKNLTLYVNATTGNDGNDGLTMGTAKQTILGALQSLPSNLGGFTATIQLYGGTLQAATYSVSGTSRLHNGTIVLDGSHMDEDAQIIGTIMIEGSCNWKLQDLAIQWTTGLYGAVEIRSTGYARVYNCKIDGVDKTKSGVYLLSFTVSSCIYNTKFTNCNIAVDTRPALYQDRGSIICAIGESTGSNNNYGIYSSHASIIFDRTTEALGSVRRVLQFGGLIVDGSGNFVKE
ncbi:MAG TPA: hypothetical protein IAA83_05340 [Candidatus Avoscillospira avistercoris]|uniref:Uncharacterized protein n=1 Tax=Candidatus Avoscillospira avistercoris TaxID=2840707 RepID=A0A9D1JU18_9FIRM|nr:hypothetical protein [Candidatus Avoscillospira avistercoris]